MHVDCTVLGQAALCAPGCSSPARSVLKNEVARFAGSAPGLAPHCDAADCCAVLWMESCGSECSASATPGNGSAKLDRHEQEEERRGAADDV